MFQSLFNKCVTSAIDRCPEWNIRGLTLSSSLTNRPAELSLKKAQKAQATQPAKAAFSLPKFSLPSLAKDDEEVAPAVRKAVKAAPRPAAKAAVRTASSKKGYVYESTAPRTRVNDFSTIEAARSEKARPEGIPEKPWDRAINLELLGFKSKGSSME